MAVTAESIRQLASAAREKIKVRRLEFDFSDSIRDYWADDNPVLTAFLTALSVSFPPGERYFIDSVRHYQNEIEDPELLEQIRAFIGQEANHSREHAALNDLMERKGYPISEFQKKIEERIAWLKENSTPEQNLARTAALEHFTAIMAGTMLRHPDVLASMDPEMEKIWAWHAIEEIEHRSVAYDVYQLKVGDEALRRRTMRVITFYFILLNSLRTWEFLKITGNRFNLRAWGHAVNVLWGRPGILRKIVPEYLSYYRKGFHPSQQDMSSLVERARQKYLKDDA